MDLDPRNTFEQYCFLAGRNILIEKGDRGHILLCMKSCGHAKEGKCRNHRILRMLGG